LGRLRVKPRLDRETLMAQIRAMRARGLTMTEIAIELGCATSTVQKWLWARLREPAGPARTADARD
jgi:hypothetical protein